MKDELREKTMTEIVAVRPKTYSYCLMVDGNADKKAKGTKKCVVKLMLKFTDFKNCLLDNKIVLKSKQILKSEQHNVYTEKINQIALGSNDNKRIKTFDRIKSYPYGSSVGKV